MKYSKLIVPVLIVGIVVWVGISWWGSKGPVDEGTPLPGGSSEEKGTSESPLAEVLATAKDLPSYALDMVTSYPGEEVMTARLWVKDGSRKLESTAEGETMVYLLQAATQSSYIYFPESKTGMQLDWDTAQTTAEEMLGEQLTDLETYQPTIVGEEILDGKNCLVTQWTAEGMEGKSWIWKEYGLPIRTEMTVEGETSVTELKNIQIGNVADSEFELPDDIQITTLPQ